MSIQGKKVAGPKRKHDLSQFGLFDVPDLDNPDDLDDSGDDDDFEAELAAITAGHVKPKPKAQKPKTIVPQSELERMVAESMRDIGSDEEVSGDDDDPDLLNELSEITGNETEIIETETPENEQTPPMNIPDAAQPILSTTVMNAVDLLKSRIEMYKLAEQQAKDAGEGTKARSRGRGVKTMETLLKQAMAGKAINMDEIPPVVSVKAPNQPAADPAPVVTPTTPPPPPPPEEKFSDPEQPPLVVNMEPTPPISPQADKPSASVDESKLNALLERQKEYKMAALTSKKAGDTATAIQYVKIIKIFDAVIASVKNGEPCDLSDMPPHPNDMPADMLKAIGANEPSPSAEQPKQEETIQKSTEEPKPSVAKVELPPPDAPKTIFEALTQRLQKYQASEANARAEGNDRKARQNGRIVKQYLDAIKMHKAGKVVAFEELPVPPGYPPIPLNNNNTAKPASVPSPANSNDGEASSPEKTSPSRPSLKKQDSRISGNHSNTSVMNKTIEILLERQRDFKAAALEAKKAGELEQAKEYLKTFKGIENLLNVARGGLPVDLSTLPISPKQREQLDDAFELLSDSEETVMTDDLKDVYSTLEKQLSHQLEKCKNWSVHHRALGDVAGTNRFENLAIAVQKDLDIIKLCHRRGSKVPKFHFEQKSFNVVRCNTHLAETEMEIEVIRGISYHVSKPKDVDTYVKIEFPYPQETPYRNKTAVIYDTENPEYNEKFIAEIQPKNRAGQRVFKRQGVKFEVYEKGCSCCSVSRLLPSWCNTNLLCCFSGFFGFLRPDTLIGTANVKLQPLETACEIHDSFDIMNGRKSCGKLEVKIKTRNPILAKQVVTESEKWLVLQ